MLFLVSRFVLEKKSCQISGQNNIVDIFVSFLSWGKTSQTTKIGSFLKRFYENVQALFRTNLRILFEADKKQRNWSIIQRVFAKCVKIISQKKMAEHVYDFSSVHNRNNRCWFYAEKNGTHTQRITFTHITIFMVNEAQLRNILLGKLFGLIFIWIFFYTFTLWIPFHFGIVFMNRIKWNGNQFLHSTNLMNSWWMWKQFIVVFHQ